MNSSADDVHVPSWAPFGITTASVVGAARTPMAPYGRMSRLVEDDRADAAAGRTRTPDGAATAAPGGVAAAAVAPGAPAARYGPPPVARPRPPRQSLPPTALPRPPQQPRRPGPPPIPPPPGPAARPSSDFTLGAPSGAPPLGMPTRGATPVDPLALIALALSLFFPPFAAIMAFAAMSRARRRGNGTGLAMLALVVAIIAFVMSVAGTSLLTLLLN